MVFPWSASATACWVRIAAQRALLIGDFGFPNPFQHRQGVMERLRRGDRVAAMTLDAPELGEGLG